MGISRRNIRLEVIEYKTHQDRIKALVKLVNERCAEYDDHDRMMIFTRSQSAAETLAAIFHTKAFHAKQNPAVCERLFKDWRDGAVWIIISTSLLGSGTDYFAVRDVINVGLPYTMFA
jgi:superfamily II DNA/RNA helicase